MLQVTWREASDDGRKSVLLDVASNPQYFVRGTKKTHRTSSFGLQTSPPLASVMQLLISQDSATGALRDTSLAKSVTLSGLPDQLHIRMNDLRYVTFGRSRSRKEGYRIPSVSLEMIVIFGNSSAIIVNW